MQVKIKKLNEKAVIPKYSKDGDAGLDMVATSVEFDSRGYVIYGTGLAIEIPKGFVGLVFPRSSVSNKDLLLSNSVGVIDSGYRWEIMAKFKIMGTDLYEVGERCLQLIILPYPSIEFVEADELSETERGICGYGSTGK